MKASIKAKKALWGMLAAIVIYIMIFCGGNVWNVSVPEYTSEVYSDREINAAIFLAIGLTETPDNGIMWMLACCV